MFVLVFGYLEKGLFGIAGFFWFGCLILEGLECVWKKFLGGEMLGGFSCVSEKVCFLSFVKFFLVLIF